MNGLTLKTRLLSGAALGAGLVFLASAPAQAACTVAAGVVTCATTTTTDTTNAGGTPASDRNYPVDTSAVSFTGTVSTGAVVDGFGLAFSNTVGGTNALNVVNNGTVQINAGNTATAGGNSALQVTAIGATPVNYSGAGSIINLSTTGDGLAMRSSGTGNLTAVVGGNVTSVGGSAILGIQSGTAGDISIGTAAGTTLLAKSNGIIAIVTNPASAGTITIVNNAAILSPTGSPNTLATGIFALTNGTGAVTVTNVGAIGSATDRVGTGISAIAKGGPLSVSGTGAIFSNGTGILATNSGTGTISINYTGPINVTGAATTGILSIAGTGATTITTGAVTAGIDAILALSSGGTQTINANGVTTGTTGAGISSSTTGARTINVGAAGNVTGGTQAILLNGSGITTINNSGIIGGAATGLAVSAPGPSSTTVNNLAGATLNGRLTLGAGADALVNSGTFNTQGTTDFGAGVDVLTNNASGIINILGATSFTGLETFTQNGRINLNANTLTLSGTPFVNGATGFIDTSGSASILGITSFSNAGTLDLAAGTFTVPAVAFTNSGTILADEGASTITGQTSFANSGTIDLQDGVVGDTLTINSAFVGSGLSSLLVDFTAFTSDLLVINGAASGTTTIGAAYLGGGLNLDGVLVVDATSASANAFVLGAVTGETPLLEVSLVQSGGDFFLVTAPTAAAFTPLVVPGFAADLWYQSADEIFAETVKPASTVGASVWGEVYASRDRVGDKTDGVSVDGFEFTVDNQLKTKRYGAQLGVDYGFGAGRIGLTGGYAWADANGEADLKAEGWNVGVYGQFGGLTGFHGEFLVKHDRYNAEFNGGAFSGEEFDIRSTGADGSLGFRFGFGEATTIDLHAGVSHVRTKVDDINAFGFNYDIGNFTSTRGRAGVRAIFGGGLAPYLGATVYREFNRDRDIEFFDGVNSYDVGNDGRVTYVRLEGGLSGNNGPGPILAAWIDILDRSGVGLRAGWRFGGRVAEVLPPPPPPVIAPPPPPPPPATQTCPDGSLILATDVCPPPPPPPPPAPEPERG